MTTAVIQVFAPEPWGKITKESDLDYEMFKAYRDTPPMERPIVLPELCRRFGVDDYVIKETARNNQWLTRTAKYDVWLEASRKQGAIRAKFELGANLVRLSKKVMEQAEHGLEWLQENDKQPSYREAVEMARLAIELQRAGFGLQGVSTGKSDDEQDQIAGDSPAELIEAAVQVNMIVRKKSKHIKIEEIGDGEVVEGEFTDGETGTD